MTTFIKPRKLVSFDPLVQAIRECAELLPEQMRNEM